MNRIRIALAAVAADAADLASAFIPAVLLLAVLVAGMTTTSTHIDRGPVAGPRTVDVAMLPPGAGGRPGTSPRPSFGRTAPEEDEPGWDCHSDGNRWCGPAGDGTRMP